MCVEIGIVDQSVTINERFPNPDFHPRYIFSLCISSPSPPFLFLRIPSPSSYAPHPLRISAFFPILFFVQESSKQNIPKRETNSPPDPQRSVSTPSSLRVRSVPAFHISFPFSSLIRSLCPFPIKPMLFQLQSTAYYYLPAHTSLINFSRGLRATSSPESVRL